MKGLQRNRQKDKERGPGMCLAFLCIMFVLSLFSRATAWQMKPEVVLRGEESRVLKETWWVRGSVLNGRIVEGGDAEDDGISWAADPAALRAEEMGARAESAQEDGKFTAAVYTRAGEAVGWEQAAELEDCLIRYTLDYGEWRSVVPTDCLEAEDGYGSLYRVERVKSDTSPYLIVRTGMGIRKQAGPWTALSYSLDDMVIAQSKPIEEGQSVRIKEDETLTEAGSLEALAAEGESFYSPFAPWMLEWIFPENCSVEAEGEGSGSRIRRICYATEPGERMEDIRAEFEELLLEAGVSRDQVRLYSFTETKRQLDFARNVRALFLWMAAVVVITVCLYQDVRCYGRRLFVRCRDEYLREVLDQELVVILMRAIFYLLGIFAVLYLAGKIGSFNLDLAGRLMPPGRVMDFSYYKALYAEWAERREMYCRLFPKSDGAAYYAALLGEWRRTAWVFACAAVIGAALTAVQRRLLIGRRTKG